MENLRKLQECNQKKITFKQAFYSLGMTNMNRPIRKLNEEEEFSALANWILNKLPLRCSMNLRLKVNDKIYQTSIYEGRRQIVVGKLMQQASQHGAITYYWPEETKYESLTVDIIKTSAKRADIINAAKAEGKILTDQQITELEVSQIDWKSQPLMEQPPMQSEQTERNSWNAVLTEEERELLSEFLDV